ncbi:MAG: histidine phosphatase family protein [Gammaproteobacteria bacterium]|nr:histidine phosphatase family protein [Gammaproteobacteria bacterium]
MRIYLARHGETQWNVERRMQGWGDSALTTLGEQQARQHGQLLNRENVSRIYASDLGRVRQTLALIREQCDVDMRFDADLRECNMGQWEGQRVEDIQQEWQVEYRQWRQDNERFSPPAGESISDMKPRISKVLNAVTDNSDSRVAFVTHGITTRVLLDLLIGLTDQQKLQLRIPNGVVHMVESCGNATHVYHFRDGSDSIEGICTSRD